MFQLPFPFVLNDSLCETSTLRAFLLRKAKLRLTCALHPAGMLSLSLADCDLSAQIAGAKKARVSGLPFEGQLTPILCL